MQLCTAVRAHADILQELAVRSGHKCNISARPNNYYALSVRWDVQTTSCNANYAKGAQPYIGKAWCVSVENGTLFARRKGKVLVTANTHRAQEYRMRTVASEAIGSWCPGTLAELQPLYRHTSPTDHTHGYAVQFVRSDGRFMHLNVPIINGWSGFRSLVKSL